mmetsp:Transcript_15472/g.35423  ORF Transcript_15472/g.35423 Transcript_15472/m.35423 type:complete len:132 (+) Transcript_15472:2364-2759(+)
MRKLNGKPKKKGVMVPGTWYQYTTESITGSPFFCSKASRTSRFDGSPCCLTPLTHPNPNPRVTLRRLTISTRVRIAVPSNRDSDRGDRSKAAANNTHNHHCKTRRKTAALLFRILSTAIAFHALKDWKNCC